MFQSTHFCQHARPDALSRIALKAMVTALTFNPFLVQAEQGVGPQTLQTVAQSHALELGRVVADDHWTRIEFSKVYIDPVVIVEPINYAAAQQFVVGIRNVDAMGFEINLKSCNPSSGAPLQEDINFSVVDSSQIPTNGAEPTEIRQHFSWGDCSSLSS